MSQDLFSASYALVILSPSLVFLLSFTFSLFQGSRFMIFTFNALIMCLFFEFLVELIWNLIINNFQMRSHRTKDRITISSIQLSLSLLSSSYLPGTVLVTET